MQAGADERRRVRSAALIWGGVAFAFYVAFIVLSVYRSRH